MTIQADTMGEQPIFTCKAHVFHIDPKTKRWAKPVLWIRIWIHRIHMFLGLLDPDPDPLVRGMDPDPALDPDPLIIMQK
jgi:hypothetical protein